MVAAVETMAYVDVTPWHGLGNKLSPGAPIEEWKDKSGLIYLVDKCNLQFINEQGLISPVDNRVALVRKDTNAVLGIASEDYKVVQPGEVLEFYRDLVSDYGFTLETAGVLWGGKRVWALAKTNKSINLKGADAINGYFLLATAYDCGFATTGSFTAIRVVCHNTLTMALNKVDSHGQVSGRDIYMKIPHNSHFRPEDMKLNLGLYDDSWEQMEQNINYMSEKKITEQDAVQYFYNVLGTNDQLVASFDKEFLDKNASRVSGLVDLFHTSVGNDLITAKDTLWGAVNAVTFWADWDRNCRGESANDNRFIGAQWGKEAKLKMRAYDVAEGMLKAA